MRRWQVLGPQKARLCVQVTASHLIGPASEVCCAADHTAGDGDPGATGPGRANDRGWRQLSLLATSLRCGAVVRGLAADGPEGRFGPKQCGPCGQALHSSSATPSATGTMVQTCGPSAMCRLCCKSILELVHARAENDSRQAQIGSRDSPGDQRRRIEILSVVPTIRPRSDFYNKICQVRTHAPQQRRCAYEATRQVLEMTTSHSGPVGPSRRKTPSVASSARSRSAVFQSFRRRASSRRLISDICPSDRGTLTSISRSSPSTWSK